MSINPLNDISKVYLEQVASIDESTDDMEAMQKDTQKSIDKLKKKDKNHYLARAQARIAAKKSEDAARAMHPKPGVSGRRIEDPKPTGSKPSGYRIEETEIDEAVKGADTEMRRAASAERRKGDKPLSKSEGDKNAANMKRKIEFADKISKAKGHIPGYTYGESLDPVGQEDADIDNDGDTDKTDKYLHKRRKAIGKAIAKRTGVKEGFSNWRQDLSEVVGESDKDNKKVSEKKVNNKIKINPNLGESVENLGGTLIEMVEIENLEGVLDELTESEIFLLSDDLIEEVVEEFFNDCIDEGYDVEYVENTLLESLEISSALLNEAKVTLGHDTKIKSDRLEKVKSAVKKAGKAAARGAGYAVGLAKRAGSAAKREFRAGYERGRGGSSSSSSGSQSTSTSSSSSDSSDKPKRSGLLSRIGSKLKSGLKKAVAAGARSVSRGARNVARKMEGGETKKAEAPKTTPKTKAEKPADPWGEPTTPPKQKAKATTKKAAAPKPKAKAKAPAATAPKRKKKSKLDSLLADIRSEQVQIDEKTLTKMEMKKREEIVKSMKDKAGDFEKRYPGRGEEVMYATATKMAKKMVEQMDEPMNSAQDKQSEMQKKNIQMQKVKELTTRLRAARKGVY